MRNRFLVIGAVVALVLTVAASFSHVADVELVDGQRTVLVHEAYCTGNPDGNHDWETYYRNGSQNSYTTTTRVVDVPGYFKDDGDFNEPGGPKWDWVPATYKYVTESTWAPGRTYWGLVICETDLED